MAYTWPHYQPMRAWDFPEIHMLPGTVTVAFEWRETNGHKVDFAARLEWHGAVMP